MDITFFIGNGFDLNLGLKTRFTDFFPRYLNTPSLPENDPDIAQFKKLLSNDAPKYRRWADFERALGGSTLVPPLNQVDLLRKCLQDFRRCFAAYLQEQQARIDFNACGVSMAQRFASDLSTRWEHLEPRSARAVQRALSKTSSPDYHILNFNYTTIIDQLFGENSSIFFKDYSSIETIIHVHGTFSSRMILGVDNLSQIANTHLLMDPRQQRLLIKPLLNQHLGQDNDLRACECLDKSDEVCVFGMSLGETDATWWQRLAKWLSAASHRQLLLFTRGSGLNPLFPEDILDCQDALRDLFFRRAGCTRDEQGALQDRIHVVVTDQFFNLSPILKPAPAIKALTRV